MSTPPLLYHPAFHPNTTWLRSILLVVEDVKRIVPKDVDPEDPESLRELSGELGVLESIPPSKTQIVPIGEDLAWLDRTFELLSASRRESRAKTKIVIEHSGGSFKILGHVAIYNDKLSNVVQGLLQRHDLIDERAHKIASDLGDMSSQTMVVEEASDAILSFIAGSIAKDTGLIATTDHPLEFAMDSLRSQRVPVRAPAGAAEGLLTGAFATVLIPREVGRIRFEDYKILRTYSQDLRAAFGKFISKCDQLGRLRHIENSTGLQCAIEAQAKELEVEYKKFRGVKSKSMRAFKNWWPLTIGGLLTLAKDIIPPEYSLGAAAMGQGVKFAEKIFAPNPDKNKEKTFSLAAELRRNILALPRVHEMMAPIKTPH